MILYSYLCIQLAIVGTSAFIPHPAIRLVGQAGDSITHTDITQLAFIRSLARFFLETAAPSPSQKGSTTDKFLAPNTIDELYQLAHPEWTSDRLALYSYPLKSIVDLIQVRNALVDFNPATKNLPSAHFDSESFVVANRRIMELRKKVIEEVKNANGDLDKARGRIGDALHTLQDFYSHSNWIEMGKTEINALIGLNEKIGRVAEVNQSTCSSNGCTKIQPKCSALQKLVYKPCRTDYYDCKNNILAEINSGGLLTSGYVSNQFNANKEPVVKPINVQKCSHGSVMDESSHQPPVGGINKDSVTPVYSPHYHLHLDAVKLAIEATERFFNDLRVELGNGNFDRLFAINPIREQLDKAKVAIAARTKFHFLSTSLSIGLSSNNDLSLDRTIQKSIQNFSHSSLDSRTPMRLPLTSLIMASAKVISTFIRLLPSPICRKV